MTLWPTGNTGLSRQIFDMLDIVTDVAMLTLLGIPILGLVALGATALQPIVGGTGRRKREAADGDFLSRAGNVIDYATDLYGLLSDLEATFERYSIRDDACQHKAICEVHRVGKNSAYGQFGDKIIDLIR